MYSNYLSLRDCKRISGDWYDKKNMFVWRRGESIVKALGFNVGCSNSTGEKEEGKAEKIQSFCLVDLYCPSRDVCHRIT